MHNIIGDIHGKESWKQLVQEEGINVFVGDYFDSKDGRTADEVIANFEDIIAFKQQRPKTVLLYGNHDLNYILDMDYRSRFSCKEYVHVYQRMFEETASLFYGVAYPIGDDILVSHAGVTRTWYEHYIDIYRGEGAKEVVARINALWQKDKMAFTFSPNATLEGDHWGESPMHSPLWIRSWVLPQDNLFAGTAVTQIFGHTPQEDITKIAPGLICVDCLFKTTKSLQL